MRIVRVTMTVDYLVSDSVMNGNGQTFEQVVSDWFENYDINRYHATRDSHAIGNSTKIISYEEVKDGKI